MYEFKKNDAFRFAKHVFIESRIVNGELMLISCPYCKGGSSNKDKGTFSINLTTGQFHCLRASCGVSGNMITLARDFDFHIDNDYDNYYKKEKSYRKLPTPKTPIIPKDNAVRYLSKRGISEETAKLYEITVQNGREDVLVFPFYDEKGELQFVKYRDCNFFKGKTRRNKDGEEVQACKEWSEKNCKPILFGMKQCVDYTRLIICEGQIDSLSVAEAGVKNAVSVPTGAKGFTWVPYCWNWVNSFDEIVIFGDFENDNISLLEELKKRLKTTIKHVRKEDYKDCKDANEILLKYGKEQVIKCVEEAVLIPISKVIRMYDVEPENPYNIKKVRTGITDIDKALYGGIPYGGLTIITGKTGVGKSTFATQIILNAIETEKKCFVYSGELSNSMAHRKFVYQAAGRNHIYASGIGQDGNVRYQVSKANEMLIANWFKDYLFLYDTRVIDDDEEYSLLNIIEETIMKYGVEVVLIDNLMTAIDISGLSGRDSFEVEKKFVNKITKIALKYNILVILVAHMRKNNYSSEKSDEISGVGAIPNLASVILTYEVDKEIDEEQRVCRLTKNRLFGKRNLNGVILDYDEKSTRVYSAKDNVDKDYSWVLSDGFAPDNSETPFE